ncbi:hypothetical protein PC119_g15536 [Phytophthora cactorum]|nr:hypothetical protein PC119_g15536 [Phytophthora cactorum]
MSPVISNIRVFGCKATRGAYLVRIPENGAGDPIPARTVVFYDDEFMLAVDNDEIQISTQLESSVQELVNRTEQLHLENIEEAKGKRCHET